MKPETRNAKPETALFWLGLLFAAAALGYTALWILRSPTADGMAYALGKLRLRVGLSASQFAAFAIASTLLALASVVVSFAVARRALYGLRPTAYGLRLWAALPVLAAFALPLHRALSWAAGGLHQLAALDAGWERRYFFRELGLMSPPQLFWLAAAIALGTHLLLTPRRWPGVSLGALVARLARCPRAVLVAVVGLTVVALAAAFSLGVQGGQPHWPDATVYYFQAKTLAAGRLWSPLPGGREFFDPTMCPRPGAAAFAFVDGRWFSVGLPGAPLLYAVGILLGAPWVIGPLLGGGLVVAIYLLTKEAFAPTAALVSLPLAAFSPWLILMSGEYMTHVPCALTGALFLVAAMRAMARSSWRAAAVAGLMLGLSLDIRPLTALGLSVPAGVAWLVWLARRPKAAWRPTLAFGLAIAVPLAAFFAYNAATTGSAFTLGYEAAASGLSAEARAAHRAVGWHWSPWNGVAVTAETAFWLNLGLMQWPLPAVGAALAALVLLGFRGLPGVPRAGVLLLLSAGTLALAYFTWPEVVVLMGGPRYFFEAAPLVIALAAAALCAIGERMAAAASAERARAVLAAVLVFCWGCAAVKTMAGEVLPLRQASRAERRIFQMAEARAERPAIIFVPVEATLSGLRRFHAALAHNAPGLDGPILYARDIGPRNRELAADRPGRHLYRLDADRMTLVPIEMVPPPVVW